MPVWTMRWWRRAASTIARPSLTLWPSGFSAWTSRPAPRLARGSARLIDVAGADQLGIRHLAERFGEDRAPRAAADQGDAHAVAGAEDRVGRQGARRSDGR